MDDLSSNCANFLKQSQSEPLLLSNAEWLAESFGYMKIYAEF